MKDNYENEIDVERSKCCYSAIFKISNPVDVDGIIIIAVIPFHL